MNELQECARLPEVLGRSWSIVKGSGERRKKKEIVEVLKVVVEWDRLQCHCCRCRVPSSRAHCITALKHNVPLISSDQLTLCSARRLVICCVAAAMFRKGARTIKKLKVEVIGHRHRQRWWNEIERKKRALMWTRQPRRRWSEEETRSVATTYRFNGS